MAGPVVIAADSPGMPDIGPDFIVEARRLAGTDEHDHEGDAAEIVAAIGSAIPEGPQLAKAMGPEWAALAKSKDPGDLAKAAGGLAEYYENASNRPDLAGWIVRFGVDWAKQCRSKSPNVLGAATRKVAAFLKEQRSGEEYAKLAGYATQLYQADLYEPGFQLMVRVGEKQLPATFVPGHLIGPPPEDGNPQPPIDPGPVPADVLVISKHPGAEEVARKRNFVGKSAEPWYRAADELGVRELISDWYVTNLVRHPQLDPSADRLAKSWITNCMPLLQTELRVVRPKFILGLGSDAAKALLGESVNVTKARNRVFNIEIPAHGGEPASVARMMVILHPGVVAHDPAQYEDFREGLAGFLKLLDGEEPQVCRTPVRQHTNIFKERHLKEVVDEIVARPDGNIIAIDCEWGAELRTIQFSARAGEGYSVVLRTEHDRPVFTPSVDAARGHLTRLFKSTPERRVRIGGHYFKADFPWLRDYGIDLSDEFDVADTPEETRTRGGFDTAYMLNSVFETGAPYELETWAVKLLGVPRYDEPINKWISSWRKANKETRASMKGYSMVPDDYLIGNPLKALPNYAAFDPDATRELFDVLNGVGDRPGLLDRDQYGLDSRRAYWISHAALPAFIEMEQTGMLVDRERLDRLASEFMDSRSRELTVLRDMIRWPDFNIGSDQQVRELLFGEEYNRKLDTKTQQARRLRPPGAVCLRLEPVKSTGKRGMERYEGQTTRWVKSEKAAAVLGRATAILKARGEITSRVLPQMRTGKPRRKRS
jgi:uracil-DNA glycosylase family 4